MKKCAGIFLTFIIFILMLFPTSNVILTNITVDNNSWVIYLDAGHGGPDGGAVSYDGLIIEKNLVLEITKKVALHLERTGYRVLMTRSTDEAIASSKKEDIWTRTKMIGDSNADLFVSIHANSYPSEAVWGCQTFYNGNFEESKKLAENIMLMLKNVQTTNKRSAKSISGKYILDHNEKIGCLVEVGFLTNIKETKALLDESYQNQIAYAIYLGIVGYIEKVVR